MSFRGTSSEQDLRFGSKPATAAAYPACYKTAIDSQRCSLPAIRRWLDGRLEELLGFADEVLAGMIESFLADSQVRQRFAYFF